MSALPRAMRAMLLERLAPLEQNTAPLRPAEMPVPAPAAGELLLRVSVCGVCHTELDEIEGRAAPPALPVVPGHQVVGQVAALGERVSGWQPGQRAGAAWIHSACGACAYCLTGRENLCPSFHAAGRDAHGGYAEYMLLPAAFAHNIPDTLGDAEAAPLLCAGAVGLRALTLCGLRAGESLGLAGFGASARLVLPMARALYPDLHVYAWARSAAGREAALLAGARWAGGFEEHPPEPLDAVIDTTPAWGPLLAALAALKPGGRLVVNAISKEDADKSALLGLDYPRHLWMERQLISVANVSRADVRACLELAARAGIRTKVREYPLAEANAALQALRLGGLASAPVLRVSDG